MTRALPKKMHPGITSAHREVLNSIGSGDFSPPMSKHLRTNMIEKGLILSAGWRRVNDKVSVEEFQMPVAVHIQWCKAMAIDYENSQKPLQLSRTS